MPRNLKTLVYRLLRKYMQIIVYEQLPAVFFL